MHFLVDRCPWRDNEFKLYVFSALLAFLVADIRLKRNILLTTKEQIFYYEGKYFQLKKEHIFHHTKKQQQLLIGARG